eukprot:sb/3468529/
MLVSSDDDDSSEDEPCSDDDSESSSSGEEISNLIDMMNSGDDTDSSEDETLSSYPSQSPPSQSPSKQLSTSVPPPRKSTRVKRGETFLPSSQVSDSVNQPSGTIRENHLKHDQTRKRVVLDENGKRKGFECLIKHCLVIKSSEKDLLEHVRLDHPERTFRCKICPLAFKKKKKVVPLYRQGESMRFPVQKEGNLNDHFCYVCLYAKHDLRKYIFFSLPGWMPKASTWMPFCFAKRHSRVRIRKRHFGILTKSVEEPF